MSEITLKSGASFDRPGLFLNPESRLDARVLRETVTRFNLDYIEGVTLTTEHFDDTNPILYDQASFRPEFLEGEHTDPLESSSDMDDLIKLIYPDMSPFLGYTYGDEDDNLLSLELNDGTPLFDVSQEIESILQQLEGITREGQQNLRDGALLPILEERSVVQNIMEFQIEQGADIVTTPSVPITSREYFQSRIDTIEEVFQRGQAIIDGGLLSRQVDYMQTLSIDPSVLRAPEDGHTTPEDELRRVLSSNEPDLIGVHLNELNHEHRSRVTALLNVIQDIAESIDTPIKVLNVDEFGLVALERGVASISCPIASNPYTRISSGGSSSSRGNYYHYEDMTGYPRERLMEMTRPEYRFPCPCDICEHFERIPKVNRRDWNEFRRVHFTLVKDSEMKRIHESNQGLSQAVRDMLSNSVRTDLVAYLS